MDSDRPSSRGGRGRSSFGTGQRGSQSRTTPYNRPTAASSAPDNGKWKHDLFGESSNLYQPTLNPSVFDNDKPRLPDLRPSPSLRPFGESTSASSMTRPSSSGAQRAEEPSHLLARVKGLGSEAQERQRREAERRKRLEEQRLAKLKADAERRAAEVRRQAEEDRAMQSKIAQQEERGHVVQVEGLVYGTSAEDVQTAFSAYGETSFCFIVNEASARESDDLVARLTFKLYDDAETACSKLNGAIADGKPLKVTMAQRTPYPYHSETKGGRGAVTAGPARTAARTVSNGHDMSQATAAPVLPPPARRMYADEIEKLDPRAQTVKDNNDGLDYDGNVGMDVDDEDDVAESARPYRNGGANLRGQGDRWADGRGVNSGNGRGSGRAAPNAPPAARVEPKQMNLLERLGSGGSRPQQQQQQGQRQQGMQQSGGRQGAGGPARGGSSTAGSLLNRMK